MTIYPISIVFSAETILENSVTYIMIHEISCITYSNHESIHGVYRFFSMQPITKQGGNGPIDQRASLRDID